LETSNLGFIFVFTLLGVVGALGGNNVPSTHDWQAFPLAGGTCAAWEAAFWLLERAAQSTLIRLIFVVWIAR